MSDISSPASIEGEHGRAWECDLNAIRNHVGKTSEQDATVAAWVIEARWAHPIWHSYALLLIHLRPMDGVDPADIMLEGATHQFFLFALDPDVERQKFINEEFQGLLAPMNFTAQFVADSDDAAIERMRDTVGKITCGLLSPDTDFLSHWIALFGDNMIKKEFR